MAGTGGLPPHHRGFEDESPNGNSPPGEREMLHITTSSTDALFPAQPTLGRVHFLSAKNSVELHKNTIVRKNSLPASFRREDYDRLLIRQPGSGPSTLFAPRGSALTSQISKKTRQAPKSVAWADMGGQALVRQSSEPETVRQSENMQQDTTVQGSRSVEQMEVDSDLVTDFTNIGGPETQENKIDVSMDPVNELEKTLNSFSMEDSTKEQGTTDEPMIPIGNQQLQAKMLPKSLIDMNNYGSFGSEEFINTATVGYVINSDDGLVNPMDIPRTIGSHESLDYYQGEMTPSNDHHQFETCPDMRTPPDQNLIEKKDCLPPKAPVTAATDRDLNNYADDGGSFGLLFAF